MKTSFNVQRSTFDVRRSLGFLGLPLIAYGLLAALLTGHSPLATSASAQVPRVTAEQQTGVLKLNTIITPTSLAGNANDYAPTGYATASTWRLAGTAARQITGIIASTEGRVLLLLNVGSYDLTLVNASASSTAANRFAFASDAILAPGMTMFLIYDATAARWRIVGSASASGSVTSVAATVPAFLTVTGSPITSSGTLAITLTASNALPVANGGTGLYAYTTGDILQATGPTALSALPAVATGNVLISGGVATASSWGKVGLTTHVTGSLPVANGGTGLTSTSNNSIFVTDGSGVASWATTIPSFTTTTATTTTTITGAFNIGTILRGGTATSIASTGVANIYGTTDGTTLITTRRAAADANAGGFVATKARGSLASPTASQSGDGLGAFWFGGYYASAWNEFASRISGVATENWTSTANGVELRFSVTPNGSTTRGDRFFIRNDGTLAAGSSAVAITDTAGNLLAAALTGNLAVARFNSGTSASSSTFWRGDGTWAAATASSAATLTTPRAIYGNNFDGSAALTQVIASTYGGTGNGFTKFSGPASTEKTFTLPNASVTLASLTGTETFTNKTFGDVVTLGAGATLNSTDPTIVSLRTLTGTGNAHGFADNATINRTGGIGYNSFDSRVAITGTASYDHVNGFQFIPTYGSSGTITSITGYYSAPIASAGTVTTLYHYSVGDATGAGTVNTQIGFYVPSLTKGAASNYAFFADGSTQSRFGKIGIGADADATALLRVYGASTLVLIEGSSTTSAGLQFKTNGSNRFLLGTPSASADLVAYAGGSTEIARWSSAGYTVTGTLTSSGGFGVNGNAAQGKYASGGTLAGVVAALVANGILSN